MIDRGASYRPYLGVGENLPDRIGIAALVGEDRLDPADDDAHQRPDALNRAPTISHSACNKPIRSPDAASKRQHRMNPRDLVR